MPKPIIYITAALLLIAIAPLPYGYYTLLRIVVTGVLIWAAVIAYDRQNPTLPWIYGILAVLFNPVIPIYLSREIWLPIDIGTAAFLFFTKDSIQDSNNDDN